MMVSFGYWMRKLPGKRDYPETISGQCNWGRPGYSGRIIILTTKDWPCMEIDIIALSDGLKTSRYLAIFVY